MANKNPSYRFRSTNEAQTAGKKGGKASGVSRRQYSTIRETVKSEMTPERLVEMFDTVWEKGKAGDMRAWEFIRDMMGEKPTERVEQTVNEITFRVKGVSTEEAEDLFG